MAPGVLSMNRVRYRIKELAAQRGMALTRLARDAAIDQSRLYNIANSDGSEDVKISTLLLIARALDVSVTDLIEEYDDGGPVTAAS